MYDQILFPTDGSEPADAVLDYAIQIASEHDATLHILTVVDTSEVSTTRIREEVIDVLEERGERIIAEASDRATDRRVANVSKVVRGDPASSIVEYSGEFDTDVIVMPTHGRRGLKRYLLGSVTERVINTAEVPVVAVNPERDAPLTYPCRDLLVPIDGSRGAELALSKGITVAESTGATLHLLHVVETRGIGSDVRSDPERCDPSERGIEFVTEAIETVEEASVPVETAIEYGEPTKKILDYVRENGIELAVLGIHGRTEFHRYMMGGVSAKIVRTSPIPVMWVRDSDLGD